MVTCPYRKTEQGNPILRHEGRQLEDQFEENFAGLVFSFLGFSTSWSMHEVPVLATGDQATALHV